MWDAIGDTNSIPHPILWTLVRAGGQLGEEGRERVLVGGSVHAGEGPLALAG
jgi:hypothetical protein